MLDLELLEELYRKYSHREQVFPDPVGFLYDYPEAKDREIVGLIASSLAYGRVAQIHKSVASVLEKMLPSPRSYLEKSTNKKLFDNFKGFKHRFTTDYELSLMLIAIKSLLEEHGSLQKYFLAGLQPDDGNVLSAMCHFSQGLMKYSDFDKNSLLPCPTRGSACKRLNLYLRWLGRSDAVDPGGWEEVGASKLLMPVDTHIYRFGLAFRLTDRKSADMKTTLEITDGFKKISPEDPVRYDFTLTKASILKEPYVVKQLKKKGLLP
jgi:uncharacterized protein (TIGR02757 family)